jgi:hypothetical protein
MRFSWEISELTRCSSAAFEDEEPPEVSWLLLWFKPASLLCSEALWDVSWRVFACSRLSMARLSCVWAASIRVVELAEAHPATESAAIAKPAQHGLPKLLGFIPSQLAAGQRIAALVSLTILTS